MTQRGETDWQLNKSVLQSNKYMLESGLGTDVAFHVRSPDGATSTTIRAHKYMLVSRSPVFEALFCGGFSDTSDAGEHDIQIEDVEAQAFAEMLKYLYYEQADITPDTVLPILYAAKKYLLLQLTELCMNFLEKTISLETVCTILNHSILYDEHHLADKCLSYIAPRCGRLLKLRSFLDLSPEALSRILRCDVLYVDSERDVFEACLRWASARIQNKKKSVGESSPPPPSDGELRAELGDNLFWIRLASMSAETFARTVGRSSTLTDAEKSTMYHHLLTGESAAYVGQLGFSLAPRMSRCRRYQCLGRNAGWWTCNGPGDAVSFAVSRPVKLIGVSVYGGRQRASEHRVVLELWRNPDMLLRRSEHVLHSDGTDQSFPLYFGNDCGGDDGADLVANESYTVLVVMKGPVTFYGQGGDVEMIADMGVTFTFSRSEKSGNGTNVKSGQIPELLFLPKYAHQTHENNNESVT